MGPAWGILQLTCGYEVADKDFFGMAFMRPRLITNEYKITLADNISLLKLIRDMVHFENSYPTPIGAQNSFA